MQNWDTTLLSQYSSSAAIRGILQNFNDAIDPAADISNFYTNIWNIRQAVGKGLDDWGAIVGISRYLTSSIDTNLYFGFFEMYSADDYYPAQPFSQAPFYTQPSTSTFALSDSDYRTLLFAKAYSNISDCSVKSINNILRMLFPPSSPITGTILGISTLPWTLGTPSRQAWVIDNLNMTYTINFNYRPTPQQLAIINTANVLPRPAGVRMIVTTA